MNKICRMCKKEKPIFDFNKHDKAKDGLDGRCRECYLEYRRKNYIKTRDLRESYRVKRNKEYPWLTSYFLIKDRCENPRSKKYPKYGKRGIRCFLSRDDLKAMWFRDKCYLMKRPTVDRIDNDGNYELSNCRYLECSENARKSDRPVEQWRKQNGN